MRILYVSPYYPPEMGAPSARVSELARHWAAAGHDVTVLTGFSHHPHGVLQPEDRGVITRLDHDGAVKVRRIWVYAARNAGVVRRSLDLVSFLASGSVLGPPLLPRPDVIVATSPPILSGLLGRLLAGVFRVPFVFEVRDLWPESILAVGALKDGVAVASLRRLAAHLYARADRIVAVGDGYARGIREDYGVPSSKITVFTNGVDGRLFRFDAAERERTRAELGLCSQFTVLYLGTHGMAHGLGAWLDAAERLKGDGNVRFLFVGDGAEKPKLVESAQRRGLDHITFLDPVPKERVRALYAAADLCLVPLKKTALFEAVLPSKMFEIMSMERPLLLSVDGEARAVVEEGRCGLFVPPEDVAAFVEGVRALRDAPARRVEMGARGKTFVGAQYDRAVIAARYLDFLTETARVTRR